MGYLNDQVAAAVKVSCALAQTAMMDALDQPDCVQKGIDVLRERQTRVWTLPADPDETLRHEEAAWYEWLIEGLKLYL